MSPTVGILGAFGDGNLGDDALMLVAMSVVGHFAVPVVTLKSSAGLSYVQRMATSAIAVQTVPNMEGSRPDVALYAGGTQYFSFPPKKGRLRRLADRLARTVRTPRGVVSQWFRHGTDVRWPSCSQPVVGMGIGLGPFDGDPRILRRARAIASRMNYVAVRDVRSYELCRQWGCNHAKLRSDLCYVPEFWRPLRADVSSAEHGGSTRVGVIVRDWPHTAEGDAYVPALLEVVARLRSSGRQVEFISFSQGDHAWIQRLRARNEPVAVWDPETDTVGSFLKRLARFDVIVTARYHGAVFASLLNKPVVCIGVEPKLELVANLFGNGARLWTYPFDLAACLGHISDIESNYSASARCLAVAVEQQASLACDMVREFGETVERLAAAMNDRSRCREASAT